MAVIKPTQIDVSDKQDGSCMQVIWTPVTEADTCNPVRYPKHSDKSVIVSGTVGGSSTAIQGSNDETNFAPLHDSGGTLIAITAAGAKQVLENTVQLKPVATGGSGQSITIAMLFHYSNPARQ